MARMGSGRPWASCARVAWATGLLVVNPPGLLAQEAEILLPALCERLAQGPHPRYRCEAIRPDG